MTAANNGELYSHVYNIKQRHEDETEAFLEKYE